MVRKIAISLFLFGLVTSAAGQNTGGLKVRFEFGGKKIPQGKAINVKKDCAPFNPIDESLLVDKKKGLANVLLYVRDAKIPVTNAAKKAAKVAAKIDNVKCAFVPRISIVQTDQELDLGNLDLFGHNVKADPFDNPGFNVLIPSQKRQTVKGFKNAERLPAKITCGIHPHMGGWVLVRPNPYGGVSKRDGTLTIEGIPEGTWEFQAWHETIGYVKSFKGNINWKRGRKKLKIEAGKTLDLGTMVVLFP